MSAYRLEVQEPGGSATAIDVGDQPITIGWGQDNTVLVGRAPEVAEKHCTIERQAGQLVVYGIDDRLPFKVNGGWAFYHQLKPGDQIAIGQATLVLREAQGGDRVVPLDGYASEEPEAAPKPAPRGTATGPVPRPGALTPRPDGVASGPPPGTQPRSGTIPGWMKRTPPSTRGGGASGSIPKPPTTPPEGHAPATPSAPATPAVTAPATPPAATAPAPATPATPAAKAASRQPPNASSSVPRPPANAPAPASASTSVPKPPVNASASTSVPKPPLANAAPAQPPRPAPSGSLKPVAAPAPAAPPPTPPRPAPSAAHKPVAAAPAAPPPAVVAQTPPRAPRDPRLVNDLLAEARERGASDLHLTANLPPYVRVNGELQTSRPRPLDPAEIESIAWAVSNDAQYDTFARTGDVDFCYLATNKDRYRANISRHRNGTAVSFRVVKDRIATVTELGLPKEASKLTAFAQGLVLITGPLGAGKTTTMFSLVDEVNRTRPDHLITVEDPIEFVIPPVKCQVSQRELGVHTKSFESALRAALREDPDIIVIGDLRDYATARLAISAAETGHLVFASMPTMNCMKSLDKLIDMFPASEQATVRTVVSESLRGILSQRLVPGTGGQRVCAVELLFNSIAIGNMIRDGKTAALKNAMQLGRAAGNRTLEWSLNELVAQGAITREAANAALEG